MKYTYRYQQPAQHFLYIDLWIDQVQGDELVLTSPMWRPGRYELGNFPKNIREFEVRDENGKVLKYTKTRLNEWTIQTNGCKSLMVSYKFYANQLDSGNSYIDNGIFYVNPVNCSLYIKDRVDEPIEIELVIPAHFKVGTGLPQVEDRHFRAHDFHQLADCPILAGSDIEHHQFNESGLDVNLWMYGIAKLDYEKVEADFRPFIRHQIESYGEFPANDYHFLMLMMPFRKYHGVEHCNSTVLTLGPGYHVMTQVYDDLIELASHEFYHSWNIKQIRPVEMFPYEYDREQLFTTGFVAEGVTTYYGDVVLARSGQYKDEKYLKILSESFQKHADNFGRYYKSLAESSIDLWLDGYDRNVPDRKMSIYSDGCLLAFAADVFILQSTNGKKSLDDVMRRLYFEFAKAGKGYSEDEYFQLISEEAGKDAGFIQKALNSKGDYCEMLTPLLNAVGLELKRTPSKTVYESKWGISMNPGENIVTGIYPNSVAEKAGIAPGDTILSINGYRYQQNLDEWSSFFDNDEAYVRVERMGHVKAARLQTDGKMYYHKFHLHRVENQSESQNLLYNHWLNK